MGTEINTEDVKGEMGRGPHPGCAPRRQAPGRGWCPGSPRRRGECRRRHPLRWGAVEPTGGGARMWQKEASGCPCCVLGAVSPAEAGQRRVGKGKKDPRPRAALPSWPCRTVHCLRQRNKVGGLGPAESGQSSRSLPHGQCLHGSPAVAAAVPVEAGAGERKGVSHVAWEPAWPWRWP